MSKYHVSKRGEPVICDAKIQCRLSGENDHFNGTLDNARKWAEKRNAEDAGGASFSSSISKESSEGQLLVKERPVETLPDIKPVLHKSVSSHGLQPRKSLPTDLIPKVIPLSGTQKVKIDRGSAESFDEKAEQADEKTKEYRRQRRTALMTMQTSKAKLLAEKAATAEKIAEKSRAEAEKIRQNPSKRYKHQKVANYLHDNGYSSGEIDLMTKYGHHPKRLRSYSAIQLVYKQGLIPQSPESKLLNEEQERTKNEHDSSVKVSDRDIDAALRGIPTESTQHLFDSGKLKKNQDMIDFYNQSRDLWANPEERHRYDRKEDGTYELKPEWKAWKQGTGSKPKEVGE